MSLRFVADVGDQPLGPLLGIALASFIGCQGGIASAQVFATTCGRASSLRKRPIRLLLHGAGLRIRADIRITPAVGYLSTHLGTKEGRTRFTQVRPFFTN